MSGCDWDVLVAGGGMAGLAAAAAAAETGAKVTLLEKAASVGGAARLSAGLIWTLPSAGALRQWVPEGDPDLQGLLAAEFAAALDWLASLGLPLLPGGEALGVGWGRAMGLGAPGRREPFLELFCACARQRGVQVLLQRRLVALDLARDGAAVEVEGPGGREWWRAETVILATGGFAANRELLARYLGAAADHLLLRTLPTCTGDGFLAGLAAGAAASKGLGSFYGHTMPAAPVPPEEYQLVTPYFASMGVLVNRYGRRFTDESAGLIEEANAEAGMHQPGGRYYLIVDQRLYREQVEGGAVSPGVPPAGNKWERARALGAPVITRPSLADLAAAMADQWGVHAPALLSELSAYNQAVAAEKGACLVPPRSRHQQPLVEPPFHAMACIPALTLPYGGLQVDRSLRVMGRSGQPLPRLWAAGADAGGVFNRAYAGGLAWALVSGRAAGRAAAAAVGKGGTPG